MHYIWGSLMLLICLYIFISALVQSKFIIYKLLYAKAHLLWKDHAHTFLAVVGFIIIALSSLFFLGIWN